MELNEICDVITCGVAKRPSYQNDGVPFLSSKNVKEDRFILDHFNYVSQEDFEQLTKHNKPERGDILYTRVGSFGEAAVIDLDFDFAIFVSLTLIKPQKDIVYPRFLMYYLNSPKIRQLAIRSTSGIGVQNLNVGTVRKFPIDLPPLESQKRIAQILDDAAALRDTTAQLLKEYDLLAQSIFLEMFGDPVVNPKGWKVTKMKEVCSKITDGTHHSPPLTKEGVPYVTAKHVKKHGLDFEAKPSFIAKEDHVEIFNRCSPEYNDVLYIKDGATTGIACVNTFEEEISLLSSLALLKPNRSVVNEVFIVYYLNHDGVKADLIRKFMSGAAIKRYTLKKINSFDIINPSIKLQNQFANKIALIEQQKELAKQELQESEDLFNCLLQKAFKGELV